eukprot:Skav218355  [mRNA]  locus=scaffold2066:27262:27663:- [translate_table: standard]
MPLATWIPKGCHHSRICEFHANLLGEERSTVSVKGEHRTFHLLILCPCIHHGGVVYAKNNNIRDALGLQFSLFRKVARHLLSGSGGGECARQAHHHNLLPTNDFRERHLLWWEALVQGHIRHLVTLGNHRSCP